MASPAIGGGGLPRSGFGAEGCTEAPPQVQVPLPLGGGRGTSLTFLRASPMLVSLLTPHFTLKEVVDDPEWWDHQLGADQLRYTKRLTAVCAAAEFIRALVGPVQVNSGLRSPRVQNSIKGAAVNSEHPLGYCLDLQPLRHAQLPLDRARLLLAQAAARFVKSDMPFDQLIWYPGDGDPSVRLQQSNRPFLHLSVRSDQDENRNRRELLASTGVGKYAPFASAQTVFPFLAPHTVGLVGPISLFPLAQ